MGLIMHASKMGSHFKTGKVANEMCGHMFPLLRGISTQLATLNSSRALAPVRLGLATNLLACPYVSKAMALGVIKDHFSWSYDDQSAWGQVEGWEVANTGKRQSPIDIQTRHLKINQHLTPLILSGWDSLQNGKFENTGNSIQFTPTTSSTPRLVTPHGTYSFGQFHFHWGPTSHVGSEHCIDGDAYASEIHFVHCKTDGPKHATDSLAVLGVLCRADHGYHSKGTHWEQVQVPQQSHQAIDVDGIDILKFLPPQLDYYHYKGSLTTPPCSERVMWYILKQPMRVPEEFLEKLRQMKDDFGQSLTHTYRQCMPLYERLVETAQTD